MIRRPPRATRTYTLCPYTTLFLSIDTHAVDKVIKGLAKLGKADGTINRYLSHLRTFLVWAKKRKYRSAPVEGEDGVEFSWREESAGRIRWITRDEEAQLKDLLPDNVWKLVKVAIETGCRQIGRAHV